MNCSLNKVVDHTKVANKFKEITNGCPLFARKGKGMTELRPLCVNCCLRIGMVLDKRAEFLRNGSLALDDVSHEPNCFVKRLDEPLKEYGEITPKQCNLNWTQIALECSRCRVGVNEPIIGKESTEMTCVRKNDLKSPL